MNYEILEQKKTLIDHNIACRHYLVDWTTKLKENASKYRMNRTVTLKHSDYGFASWTIHTTQAEGMHTSLTCDCLNVLQF